MAKQAYIEKRFNTESHVIMTRDLVDRLMMLSGRSHGRRWEVRRITLNMDQIEELNPPPNPAKETDARFAGYRERFGDESWELDALEPAYLNNLIREKAEECIDDRLGWDERQEEIARIKERLSDTATEWESE